MSARNYNLSLSTSRFHRITVRGGELLLDNGYEPILCDKALACRIGFKHALIVQALHQAIERGNNLIIKDGESWLKWSLPELNKNALAWMSESTIRRYFRLLEEMRILLVDHRKGTKSKLYRLDYQVIESLVAE